MDGKESMARLTVSTRKRFVSGERRGDASVSFDTARWNFAYQERGRDNIDRLGVDVNRHFRWRCRYSKSGCAGRTRGRLTSVGSQSIKLKNTLTFDETTSAELSMVEARSSKDSSHSDGRGNEARRSSKSRSSGAT